MIFKDAKSALNPRERVFDIIVEGAKNLNLYKKSKKLLVANLMEKYLDYNSEMKHTTRYKIILLQLE
ncbi:MAG: hypothetical protein DSZ21_00285 [Tenericutes bacterium]|nr:MAG: hypothetical protein DSZ21_00285 [Mycoplasmatota bacterium]